MAHLLFLLTQYRSLFVHPEWHLRILPESLRSGLSIGPQDLLDAMQPQGPGESRPRWLNYLIVGIDQKLRLWAYDWLPVHPTLTPVAWTFQLLVTPYLLYRLLLNLTRDRAASLAGLAVYLSSLGCLSGFAMAFMPGKTLTNTVFVGALYAASVAAKTLRPGQSLADARGPSKYLMLLVLFLGLFIDELPIAAFLLVPACFAASIVPAYPWRAPLQTTLALVKNGLFFALPLVAFFVMVLFVAPPIIEREFGVRFDYLGDTLRSSGSSAAGGSVLDGRVPLTASIVLENASNLFGLSLAPWQLSPLVTSPYGDFPGSQVTNLPKLLLLLAFFGVCAFVIARTRSALRFQLLGLLLALPLFFFFLSFVMVRHMPIVTGYYYGAGFASLFAIIVGMLVQGVSAAAPRARLLAGVVVLGIVAVQLVNFAPINAGWIATHNGQVTDLMLKAERPGILRRTPMTGPGELSTSEVDAIWRAWKSDQLDGYLRRSGVSGAALYEVYELRAIERIRPRP